MRLYSTLDHFITSVFLVYKCYISVHCNSLFVKEVKKTFLGTDKELIKIHTCKSFFPNVYSICLNLLFRDYLQLGV